MFRTLVEVPYISWWLGARNAWFPYQRKLKEFQLFLRILTLFVPLVSFYTPWKHQTTFGSVIFSGGIEREEAVFVRFSMVFGTRTTFLAVVFFATTWSIFIDVNTDNFLWKRILHKEKFICSIVSQSPSLCITYSSNDNFLSSIPVSDWFSWKTTKNIKKSICILRVAFFTLNSPNPWCNML